METTLEATMQEMIDQLETTLSKLALAAECKISTGNLEKKAQTLATKISSAATLFDGLTLYKDVEGSELYAWDIAEKLPEDVLSPYAYLCKRFGDTLKVRKNESVYYIQVAEGVYVNASDLPQVSLPKFKVKIEGNTLMAVRSDMLRKLPKETQKLLGGKDTDD